MLKSTAFKRDDELPVVMTQAAEIKNTLRETRRCILGNALQL